MNTTKLNEVLKLLDQYDTAKVVGCFHNLLFVRITDDDLPQAGEILGGMLFNKLGLSSWTEHGGRTLNIEVA